MKDKKGSLGLNTAKIVMIGFLILCVIAIAIFLAVSSLRDAVEDIDKTSTSVVNETLSSVTGVGVEFAYAPTQEYRNAVCSGQLFFNATGGEVITSPNYTTSSDGCIVYSAQQDAYNNSDWNVTYSVTYSNPESNLIASNITQALDEDFFDQTGTIFAILIVVVIMMAIGLIIYVVTRFSSGAGVNIGGSSRDFGSDTVMGI